MTPLAAFCASCFLVAFLPQVGVAQSSEGVIFNRSTGNYEITYRDEQGTIRSTTFVPATKIAPKIRSAVTVRRGGIVNYSYSLRNERSAVQAIEVFTVPGVTAVDNSGDALPPGPAGRTVDQMRAYLSQIRSSTGSPSGWYSTVSLATAGSRLLRVSWIPARAGRRLVKPGEDRGGFSFQSRFLPGLSAAKLSGDAPILEFVDEGPDGAVADELERLRSADFVSVQVAVPKIPVQPTTDRQTLLRNIRSELVDWVSKDQIEASLFAEIDRRLAVAIDASTRGDDRGVLQMLTSLREPSRHACTSLRDAIDPGAARSRTKPSCRITELAAEVLDFNLIYALHLGHVK